MLYSSSFTQAVLSRSRRNQLQVHIARITNKLEKVNGDFVSKHVHHLVSNDDVGFVLSSEVDTSATHAEIMITESRTEMAPGFLTWAIWSCKPRDEKIKLLQKSPV